MPRVCSICIHQERDAIDQALAAQEPYRIIAQRFAASPDAILRHKREHLPATLVKARNASEVAHADNLLAQVRALHTKALSILEKAEMAGQLNVAVMAIREARGNLELQAKLLGELNDSPTVNILVAPEWLSIRSVLMDALRPYPEARTTVAQSLAALEAGQ